MSLTEEKITLEQMPQLLVELKGEILGIKEMIAALSGGENSTADQWMDLDAFRAYHPDKPARATVYEWVSLKKVPVHKDGNGKRLRFLKREIDEWLTKGRQKTQDEIDQEAFEIVKEGQEMSQPQHLSEILLKVAADPTDPFAKILRQCPFIQAELIHRKLMSLDDLTDEQIDRLIEWDQSQK